MNLQEARIGLALSGGGFRATLFHLGVIRLLREAGALNRVRHISAVSGGSIIAAHLVLNWEAYNGTDAQFETAAQELIRFVQTDIRGNIIRRWFLGWITVIPQLFLPKRSRWTFGNLLQGYYAKLFRNAKVKDLRRLGRPEVSFNCASLTTGCQCLFDESGFTWYEDNQKRSITATEITVAFAVAASSAFPPLFPPIEISNDILSCDKEQFHNSHFLTDGGIYDNLGIETLVFPQIDARDGYIVVVSDAEGNFDANFDSSYSSLISRNVRASDLLMKRVSALQIGHVGEDPPVIRIAIKGALDDLDDVTILSPEAQRSLINIRTDLDEFSPYEVTSLISHSYNKARYQLIKDGYLTSDTPKYSWDPIKNWNALRTATSNLRRSSRRRWRLWSLKDPISYVTTFVLLYYATVLFAVPFWIATIQNQQQLADQRALLQFQRAQLAEQLAAQVTTEANLAATSRTLSNTINQLQTLNVPLQGQQQTGWQLARLGDDCPGRDITDTVGPQPVDDLCTGSDRTAVCWDGTMFSNPSKYNGAAWCTYKDLPPEKCVGGSSPGRLFRCIPKQDANKYVITTYKLCVGELAARCPSDAIHLPCEESVADWAKGKCQSFSQARISTSDGNRCGYSVLQLACTRPAP